MGLQVIPIPIEQVSYSLLFPFPFLFYSRSRGIPMGFPIHGIPIPIGNPIPMHIFTSESCHVMPLL